MSTIFNMIQLSKFLRPSLFGRRTAIAKTRVYFCSAAPQDSFQNNPQMPAEPSAVDAMIEIDEAKLIKGPEKDIENWNVTCSHHDCITYLNYDQDAVRHLENNIIEHDYYISHMQKKVRKKSSLLKLVYQYQKKYSEKVILLHPETAKRVANKIAENTEADPTSTWLVDGEGGFSLVAEELMRRGTFSKLKICSRDEHLKGVHDHAVETRFSNFKKVSKGTLNLNNYHSTFIEQGVTHDCELTKLHMECNKEDGNAGDAETITNPSTPPMSIFGVIAPFFLRTLALKHLLKRVLPHSPPFHGAQRMEYFFLVHPVTLRSLMSIRHKHRSAMCLKTMVDVCTWGALDIQHLGNFPRSAFFPPSKVKYSVATATKTDEVLQTALTIMEENRTAMCLIKVRPLSNEQAHFDMQEYGVLWVYFTTDLIKRHRSKRLIPAMERMIPGIGLDLIKAGFDLFAIIDNLSIDQFLLAFRVLISRPRSDLETLFEISEKYIQKEIGDLEGMYLESMRKTFFGEGYIPGGAGSMGK